MKISLQGLTANLRRGIREGAHVGGELFMIDELVRHLAMVKANHSRLGEFFNLYVDVEPIREDPPQTALDLMGYDEADDLVERMTPEARAMMREALRDFDNREYRARKAG